MTKLLYRGLRYKKVKRVWRRLVPLFIVIFAWSSTLATGAHAYAYGKERDSLETSIRKRPIVRQLSPAEMRAIRGSQGSGSGISYDAGSSYAWEGKAGDVTTCNGNRQFSVPIVGWTAKGGMPVNFTLYHSSKSNYSREVGQKWSCSYILYVWLDVTTGNVSVHWGDDLGYTFTPNMGGSFTPPTGIHDTLTTITGGYQIVTKDQITYKFTKSSDGRRYNCSTITDLRSNVITLNYNGGNMGTPYWLASIVDPTNRTISITYTNNKISSISDPLSRSWSFSYNSNGELTQATFPTVGGNSYNCQFAYDSNHDITTYTDKRSKTWTANYNSDSTVAWEKDPYLNQTQYSYTATQVTITDPNSKVTKHNYTGSILTSVVDPLNNTESYQYDSANNRTTVTDRRSNSSTYTFDSAGNVLTATDPLTHCVTTTYNSKNQVLTVTDAAGHQVVNTYDTNGNLTQTQEKDAGGTVMSTTTFTYNTDGTVATKVDSNSHTTTYGYNSNGHLTSVTTPNSHVTSFGVNTIGVRTSRTDALSRTTNYTLDNWERVTTIDYPTGTDPTLSYDAESNLTGWTDVNGTWARTYDDAGRMTAETLGGSTVVSYAYDATGKKGLLSSLTDSGSRSLTYSYTDRNQLYQVVETAGTASYEYDANGNETGLTNQNGTTVTRVFDAANRLTSITNKNSGGTTLSSFSYGYNSDNQRTSCTENNGDVVSYGYDGAHRLTSESRTGTNSYSRSYVVDGVGNRTSQTVGGTTTSFTLDNDDELTATSGGFTNSYGYNSNGEQTSRTLSGTAYTLAYDYEGQLTSITLGGSTTSFAYDALGRRYSRTAGGTTTAFQYSGIGVLLEKQGATTTATYSYGNALLRKDGEYPMFDGLGSERTVTNSSQTVTGTIMFEGFGQTIATTGSSGNPYLFAATSGYRNDGDAGLMKDGARYYDAQVGRFITRDSELKQHPYLYCEHEPVDVLDPSGHNGFSEWIGRTLGLDFNFSREDIRMIGQHIEQWGTWEISIGGLGGGGTILSGATGNMSVPGFQPGKYPSVLPNGVKTSSWSWARPTQIMTAVSGGLLLGGGVAILIGKWWQYCAGDHDHE